MAHASIDARLAVCSWSLQPRTPQELLDHLQNIGISRIQLALDPIRENPSVWGEAPRLLAQGGIQMVSGMFGTIGEDYSTLESIRRTGGVVPDQHWEANWRNIQATAELANRLQLSLLTMHAGFLPHEETDPSFDKLLKRVDQIAGLFEQRGLKLGFETGQETAETLLIFLKRLGRSNVGVNFDPANLLLYDKGDPITALGLLSDQVLQCHVKDATRTCVPGQWGEEVVVGTGQVDWQTFFRVLEEARFGGPLCIEREAGTNRAGDIRVAAAHVRAISASMQRPN